MLEGSLFWIIIFTALTLIMISIVPMTKIIRLLPFGLIAGFLLSITLMYLFVNVFNLWKFNYTGFFSVAGVPLFSSLSWTPTVILYVNFLSLPKKKWLFYGYVAGASIFTTVFVWLVVGLNYIDFIRWNIYYTFLMAFTLFSILNFFLARIRLLDGEGVGS